MLDGFGNRLKTAIHNSGRTQREFARDLGTTAPVISHYIKGKCYPRVDTIVMMADLLDVSTDYLLGTGYGRDTDLGFSEKEEGD